MSEDARAPLFGSARWQEVRALIERLDGLSAEQREEEFATIAAADVDLANAARALLGVTQESEGAPLWDAVDRLLPPDRTAAPVQIGPFRVLERIGAGGMGVIYLAERRNADFSQRVALKLLDDGVSRHAHLAARERRVLAGLAHPNITAFVDAGTHDGRAWLAMEYVDGEPLLSYCEHHRLDIRDRVRLFDQVCAAVAHAHAQLVVHRDLKPTNVLVNREGTVKLLDFGIALVLDSGDDKAPATRVFTPGYAAPEQVRGERVTTATDVYALALLLFELVSGRHLPARESDAAWTTAELARLATPAPDVDQTAAAYADPKAVTRVLRGDLGRIIAHGLAPNPAQRYASVVLLREDLKRWLEHRPLSIGRHGLRYVAAQFVRRHRAAVAIAAIGLIGLIGLSAVAVWQARVAHAQAHRATAVKDFLLEIFKRNSVADPDGVLARQTTAEQLLKLGADRIRTQLQDVPDVRAELLGTMGQLYADLALSEPAIALYEEQVRTLRDARSSRSEIAAAQVALGAALAEAGRAEDSTRVLDAALQALDQIGETTSTLRASAYCYLGRNAYTLLPADDPTAVRHYTQALRIIRTFHPDDPLRITAELGLARAAEYAGDLEAAEAHYRQGLSYAQSSEIGGHRLDAAGAYQQLGDLLRKRQRFDEAEKDLRAAVAVYAQAAGADNPWTASAQQDLAKMLADTGRRGEAEKLLSDALQIMLHTRGAQDQELVPLLRLDLGSVQLERGELEAATDVLTTCRDGTPEQSHVRMIALARLAQTQLAQGRFAPAEKDIAAAIDAITPAYGVNSGTLARARLTQAELWLAQGDPGRAEAVFEEVANNWPAKAGTISPQYVQASMDLAQLRIAAGHPADAAAIAGRVLAQIQSLPQAQLLASEEAQARFWLGEALRLEHQAQRSLPHLQRAVALREILDDANSPTLARARVALADCLLDLNRRDDARPLLEAAASALAHHAQLATRYTEPLVAGLARLHAQR